MFRRGARLRNCLHVITLVVALLGLVVLVSPSPQAAHAATLDPNLTPGATNASVSSATLCSYPAPREQVTQPVRARTFRRYGIAARNRHSYELAALVPFELGGAPTATNLWPRMKRRHHLKRLNVVSSLHRQFCESKISLSEAQRSAIVEATGNRISDWEARWSAGAAVDDPVTSIEPTTTMPTTMPTTTTPATTTTTATTATTSTTAPPTTSPPSPIPPSSPSNAPPPAGPTGAFSVVGTSIHELDGSTFVPNGANVGTQGSFDWWGDALGHSDSAQAWGWNSIRLTLYTGDPFAPAGTAKSRAQQIIDEYTAKGIVVILADWSCFSKGSTTTPSLCAPQLTWMKNMAAANKTNPYVWINCYNEPHATDAAWVTLQNACTDTVRAAGDTAPIVDDLQGAGADASWSGAANRTYEPTMAPAVLAHDPLHNVVFSQHNYAGYCDTTSEGTYLDKMHAAGLAVMMGEFGYTDNGSSSAGGYDKDHACALANFAAAPPRGVGLLAWHATMGDRYALRTSGQPFYGTAPLTDFGQRLWNLTH